MVIYQIYRKGVDLVMNVLRVPGKGGVLIKKIR